MLELVLDLQVVFNPKSILKLVLKVVLDWKPFLKLVWVLNQVKIWFAKKPILVIGFYLWVLS